MHAVYLVLYSFHSVHLFWFDFNAQYTHQVRTQARAPAHIDVPKYSIFTRSDIYWMQMVLFEKLSVLERERGCFILRGPVPGNVFNLKTAGAL